MKPRKILMTMEGYSRSKLELNRMYPHLKALASFFLSPEKSALNDRRKELTKLSTAANFFSYILTADLAAAQLTS